jgi:hypothetical protein
VREDIKELRRYGIRCPTCVHVEIPKKYRRGSDRKIVRCYNME